MAHRIEVGFLPEIFDAPGTRTLKKAKEAFKYNIREIRIVYVYTVDKALTRRQLEVIASGPFSDPLVQSYSIDEPLFGEFDWAIEVGFLPGVTDNVGRTAREAIEHLGIFFAKGEAVYTSLQYRLKGKLRYSQVKNIATKLLANELIQRTKILSYKEWKAKNGFGTYVPKVMIPHEPKVEVVDLDVSDEELMKLSRQRVLALSLDEMKIVRDYYKSPDVQALREKHGLPKDKPTDVELECLAQTWSEHCKHKIFNALIIYHDDETKKVETINSLFKTYVRKATERVREMLGESDFCLSVFVDNAGVMKFDDSWSLVMKVETHNSPSALDPYGGALTGIVGVNRDPFGTGKGAKLIFNTDVFCFAPPNYSKPLPPRLHHPRRVMEGVREGVEHGGNKSGIPTVNGSLVFHDRFLGKPLVYCGTGGIMPAVINGEPSYKKGARPKDRVIMVGGRIGKDGIHGATFSSEELHEGSPATAVQIGDPITQKRMTDFLLIARDRGLYTCITDNGAGGLSSSVGETARYSGGAAIDIELAPLKYAGLDPWEIFVSESQERMTVAVPPEKLAEFMELAKKMRVEATDLGEYSDSGYLNVMYKGKTVGLLDMDFLHEGLPQMKLEARWQRPKHSEPKVAHKIGLGKMLHKVLARYNVCSKEYVVRQYDHEVQGGSTIKPLVGKDEDGPSDAAVIRPILGIKRGVVVSHGICPKFSDLDAYWMAACAIDEGVRNNVAVGGNPYHMAGLDNFCWCDPIKTELNPDGDYKLAQLVRTNRALYEACTTFEVPLISGKDSMKNDYKMGDIKISIPPTLLFTVLSVVEDSSRCVTLDVKSAGDAVYILGMTRDELGGSEYFAELGYLGNNVPKVNFAEAKRLYRSLYEAIRKGLVRSCHDISDGGLAVALAESAFSGGFGITIDLRKVPYEGIKRKDFILFSETPSRFVVTVKPKNKKKFEKTLSGCIIAEIGRTTQNKRLAIKGASGKNVINEDIYELKASWKKPLNL